MFHTTTEMKLDIRLLYVVPDLCSINKPNKFFHLLSWILMELYLVYCQLPMSGVNRCLLTLPRKSQQNTTGGRKDQKKM